LYVIKVACVLIYYVMTIFILNDKIRVQLSDGRFYLL